MSAAAQAEPFLHEQPSRGGLPADALALLVSTSVLAAAGAAVASTAVPWSHVPWTSFAVILAGAALAQLFATPVGGHQGFHTGSAFTLAAALLLPVPLVVLVCVVQHLPDWLRHRYRWYVQSFNIANYALGGLAAWATWHAVAGLGSDLPARAGASTVLAGAAAVGAFVLVNHVLLARMLKLARGRGLKSTRLFSADSLVTDVVLGGTGFLIAFALVREPALTPVAALPLVLIHRSLVVPSLRDQALRDHKTGLLNSRGIEQAAGGEFARARRFGRPLSVLLCDIDDLRGINNRHGHLEGDAALLALAGAFRAELRSYDHCARFGGDEFVVVLPETDQDAAVHVAERIREWLRRHPLPTGEGPVEVGVSIGTACCSDADGRIGDVIARADASMYEAKRTGRHSFVTVG